MPSASAIGSHSGLFTSTAERRSFFYFQSRACKPLGGSFNSSFWGREVMQAALHYPPIRHLVIALGNAYETFEAGTPGQGTQFTLQQCNHSIRQLSALTQGSDSPSADVTCCVLTASILFIYLASIRGAFTEAFQHIRSAIKVLQDFERSLQETNGTTTPSYPVPLSQVRSLLISMYGQLRAMVDDVPLEGGPPDILISDVKPATIFTSVQEAHLYIEKLFHNTLAFLQQAALRRQPTAEQLEAAVTRHRELCEALESSQNALDVLAGGLLEAGNTQAQEGTVILRVYHLWLAIQLRIDIFRPEERESAFDELEDYLEQILGHCEILIKGRQDSEETTPQRSCVSGLGYVMPLHLVAARCRNPHLRRRALELLMSCPRREGLWDAQLTGKVVSQTIAIEEDAMVSVPGGDGRIMADKRVMSVKIEFDGETTASLRFVTVDDWKKGRSGSQSAIQI